MLKGFVEYSTKFNIDGKEINGYVKRNEDDIFIEISYNDMVFQKIYTGDLNNENEMLYEIENLISENF